jgi:type III pantothenate kinase
MKVSIFAIDAGNTRIKWGVHDGAAWRATGAVETAKAGKLAAVLERAAPRGKAIASNVAGPKVKAAITAACKAAGLRVTFVRSAAAQLGVTNGYRTASQLGTDRWVALIAAHHARRGHKLVVNAGTALTVDAITDDGRFLGGLIVPGPALMRRSLDRATAALREAQGAVKEFPTSTPEAIATGAIAACAGAVDRLAKSMDAHASPAGLIILSGGAAWEIAPALGLPHELHENLVLDGLQLIARSA